MRAIDIRILKKWCRMIWEIFGCCLVDLGQPDAIAKLIDFAVAEFQRIDVLINNAAIVPKASLGDLTEEDFQATVEVNLKPVFIGSQTAFPIL